MGLGRRSWVVVVSLVLLSAQAGPPMAMGAGADELWGSEIEGDLDVWILSEDGARLYLAFIDDELEPEGIRVSALDTSTGDVVWSTPHAADDPSYLAGALSPDEATLYVAADEDDPEGRSRIRVSAIDTLDGSARWDQVYNDPRGRWELPNETAVSLDGTSLFIVGYGGRDGEYLTVAVKASNGAERWMRTFRPAFQPPYGEVPSALHVAASPSGSTVYVLGNARRGDHRWDWNVLAYRVSTGERLWVHRWAKDGEDFAEDLLVAPGGAVLVPSTLTEPQRWRHARNGSRVIVQIAPESGKVEEVTELDGADDFYAADWEVNLSRERVYLAGYSRTARRFEVRAFHLGTGSRTWTYRYETPVRSLGFAQDVESGPSSVVVSGAIGAGKNDEETYRLTMVLSLDGRRLWTAKRSAEQLGFWDWTYADPLPTNGTVLTTYDEDGAWFIHADKPV